MTTETPAHKNDRENLLAKRGKTVGNEIADILRERIRAEHEPGDELDSEGAIAAELGVSQRAIRDAFRILTQQGLIETRQGKRAIVSRLRPVAVSGYFRLALDEDSQSMADLVELREALETKAVARAATRMGDAELQELRTTQDSVTRADTIAERVELDLRFHFLISKASGNRFFESLSESLATVLAEERRRGQELTEERGTGHTASNSEHESIIEALMRHDPVAAESAMRTHLQNVAARLQ